MRWQGRRESTQVEDRRGMRAGGPRIAAGGCGTIVLVLVISWLTGVNPLELLRVVGGTEPGGGPIAVDTTGGEAGPVATTPEEDRMVSMSKVVLADLEDTWGQLFAARNARYELPTLVFYRDAVESACGFGRAAMGPFYCPNDGKLYLDLAFFDELDQRFGAPGDFAQAYVIAHEVGHHVQNLLGTARRVADLQQRAAMPEQANALSVRLELQADCYAGVWGHYANRKSRLLEPGDAEEGLAAAAAIGDDRLQRASSGRVAPESWTHGSSEMRVRWLSKGLEDGDMDECDTFSSRAF